jgi:hypothetical protein
LTSSAAPQPEGTARAALLRRSSCLQIIAPAGSGQTGVVAQRFAQSITLRGEICGHYYRNPGAAQTGQYQITSNT